MADTYGYAPPIGAGSQINFATDYKLISLNFLSSGSNFDMRPSMIELCYSEDIFSSVISGYLYLLDSQGWIEKFQTSGNEFLVMKFGKNNDPKYAITKTVRVYKVTKRDARNEGNTETYSFYFCSEELLLSEQYKINKSYPNTDITTIVKDILTNKNLKMNVDANRLSTFQQTYGYYSFIIPNLKPFDAINWLSTYAQTNLSPGADFLFFENKDGFNFVSLQTLYNTSSLGRFTFAPKNLSLKDKEGSLDNQLHNVMTFEILDSYDKLESINSGMFANNLLSVDILTRNYKNTSFSYEDYISKRNTKKLNPFELVNNFANRNGDRISQTANSVTKLIFSNFDSNNAEKVKQNPGSVAQNIYAEVYVPYRTAQLQLLAHTRLKITVAGNPDLTVGRVVEFSLLSKNPREKTIDKYYSGRYLITAIKHMITSDEYKCVIELSKESSVGLYGSVDTSVSGMSDAIRGKS
jgi:hypothetical protein